MAPFFIFINLNVRLYFVKIKKNVFYRCLLYLNVVFLKFL
jgi:hypothetical protein